MGRSRVVLPETQKLDISNGDWLLVKKRLNHGERQAMFARKYESTPFGSRVNLTTVGLEKPVTYLLDWSLVGPDGQQIVIKGLSAVEVEHALNALDEDTFQEIVAAIDRHEAAMQKERAAEKNAQGGASASPAISPSPDAAAGATSGSAS